MSTQPTSEEQGKHSHDAHDAHEAVAIVSDNDELEGIKMVALESAELATRSANLAVGAGENMKKATLKLEQLMKANKKQHQIMLGIAGWFDVYHSHCVCHVHLHFEITHWPNGRYAGLFEQAGR